MGRGRAGGGAVPGGAGGGEGAAAPRLSGRPHHIARFARATTASNSTWQPASASSGTMLSASLWRQPVLAGREDHRRRHAARDIDRVVPGAGDDLARREAEPRAPPGAPGRRRPGSKGWAGMRNSSVSSSRQPRLGDQLPRLRREARRPGRSISRVVGVAELDARSAPRRGPRCGCCGDDLQLADRAAAVLAARAHQPVHQRRSRARRRPARRAARRAAWCRHGCPGR